MLLLLAVQTQTTWAQQIITGYTATSGTAGANTSENYDKLVDGNSTSKWCVTNVSSNKKPTIEFNSNTPIILTGYIMTTGADAATCTGRNPKSWVIEAKQNSGDAWTVIANVTNNTEMQDVNTQDYEFSLPNSSTAYKYFRFTVSATQNSTTFQLAEFRFKGYETTAINLGTLTDDYTAQNGDVLTGTLSGNYKISIANGATVTLNGVTINGGTNSNAAWAGITCLGNATILLEGTNKVTGFYNSPGILAGSNSFTLTINGTGSLEATGRNNAAGIGGGNGEYIGDIIINGGTITARGGENAAGIGGGSPSSGYYAGTEIIINGGNVTAIGGSNAAGIGNGYTRNYNGCGHISINGGTVNATGGQYAAGIGSGKNAICNNISISSNVTSVKATKGSSAPNSIGSGSNGQSGTVTIGGLVTGDVAQSTVTYNPSVNVRYTVRYDSNDGTGTMADQEFLYGFAQNLTANTFTCNDRSFLGWATTPSGSVAYADGQSVSNLASTANAIVTLYAVWPHNISLSTIGGDFIAINGDVLTGTLSGNYKISIADGATVTLNGITINGVDDQSYDWAGITCLSNATIILNGNNTVKGFKQTKSGIYVPAGKTLCIKGNGQLNASAHEYGCGIEAAGNVIIESGTIIAVGGPQAAGIGTRNNQNHSGNITITGGTVTATGGSLSAGIGSASFASCGNITISGGTVTATKGSNAPNSIGAGKDGTCGTITIGGLVTGNITQSPISYNSSVNVRYTVHFDSNGGTGTMADQDFLYGFVQNLRANTFTYYEGHSFLGWATTPTGNKVYNDGQSVSNLANTANATVTLYAIWNHNIDLSAITTNLMAVSGDVLTGTLDGNYKISVADGATVTLNGVTIPGRIVDDNNTPWAGITCLGNAVIILADGSENDVKGYNCYYPGIQGGPASSLLNIKGNGSLTATTGMKPGNYGNTGYGAGIGGAREISCGNILVEGGTITANGGSYSAGIGSGMAYLSPISCGDITISSGTITATGGMMGAGIGSGSSIYSVGSPCGAITILGGTITATGGYYGPGIGSGSSCGTIIISGGTVTATGVEYAAGIGSTSHSECNEIIINGGIVEAIGGEYGSGIGSSAGFVNGSKINQSNCGNITITSGVISVTATKGNSAVNSIGQGGNEYSTCGTVTIGDVEIDNIAQSPFVTYPYTVTFNANGGEGTMADQIMMYNVAKNLTANTFTNTDGIYVGWNSMDDGSGTDYANEQSVSNLTSTQSGTATLYAQWQGSELVDGTAYKAGQDGTVTTATYTKALGEGRVGKHQAWFVPFDYTITSDDAEKFNFYKINMIANAPAPGEGEVSDDMWVFLTKVGAGTVLHANMPYVYKPLVNIESYDFTTTNATLKAKNTGVVLKTETAEDVYSFYGVYENISPSTSDPFYYVNYLGTISFGNVSSVVVGPYRWIIRKTSKFGDATAYARNMHFYEFEEATSIGEELGVNGEVDSIDTGWFDLQGRKLSQKPTQSGIYVNNGKKVFVK